MRAVESFSGDPWFRHRQHSFANYFPLVSPWRAWFSKPCLALSSNTDGITFVQPPCYRSEISLSSTSGLSFCVFSIVRFFDFERRTRERVELKNTKVWAYSGFSCFSNFVCADIWNSFHASDNYSSVSRRWADPFLCTFHWLAVFLFKCNFFLFIIHVLIVLLVEEASFARWNQWRFGQWLSW